MGTTHVLNSIGRLVFFILRTFKITSPHKCVFHAFRKLCKSYVDGIDLKISKNIPKISMTIRKRRVRFAGHCARASEELIPSFVLWRHHHSHHGHLEEMDGGLPTSQ